MEAHSFDSYTLFCNPFLDYAIMLMHYILLTTLMNVTNGEYLGLILQRVYLIDSNSDLKQKQKMQIILVGYIRTWDNKVINNNTFWWLRRYLASKSSDEDFKRIKQNYSCYKGRRFDGHFKIIFLLQKSSLSFYYLLSVLLHFMSNICVREQELTSNALEKLEEYKSIARASLDLPSFTCL